jgi:hypothetical protein
MTGSALYRAPVGAEAWNTFPSKDGGVDAVAVSKHLPGQRSVLPDG